MGGVDLVLPEDPAGGDDADGGALLFHDPHLHGAGLAAEMDFFVLRDIEGVRPFPDGVALGDVQPVKVIFAQLDLRALGHLEAHADKNVHALVPDDLQGMPRTQHHRLPGDGHVHGLLLQLPLQKGVLQGLGPLLQRILDGSADHIGHLADLGPLLGAEAAQLLQYGAEAALLAQVLDPQGVQSAQVHRFADGLERFLPDALQLAFHLSDSSKKRFVGNKKTFRPNLWDGKLRGTTHIRGAMPRTPGNGHSPGR